MRSSRTNKRSGDGPPTSLAASSGPFPGDKNPPRTSRMRGRRFYRPGLASPGPVSARAISARAVAALLASLLAPLAFLMTLRLPLRLACLALLLVFLEGAARPAVPFAIAPAAAVPAAALTVVPATAALTALPVAAAAAIPAPFVPAPPSSLAHGFSFR